MILFYISTAMYTHVHKWRPEINKTMFTPTSTFMPVRSADSSLRDCALLEMQTVADIMGKPVNIPSDIHNNLQIHH